MRILNCLVLSVASIFCTLASAQHRPPVIVPPPPPQSACTGGCLIPLTLVNSPGGQNTIFVRIGPDGRATDEVGQKLLDVFTAYAKQNANARIVPGRSVVPVNQLASKPLTTQVIQRMTAAH